MSKITALEQIEDRLEKYDFDFDTNIYIVLWMPTSDIGKWTLVAHLLSLLPDADVIKFDGSLNTNWNGRHTAVGWDDFWIYEKYNPGRSFWKERYILWGEIIKEFIEKYWEEENLCFRPHLWKYFVSKLWEMFLALWKPKNLIIEIWGTLIDYEVDPYVVPAIHYIKQILKDRCKIVLLTMLDWNQKYVKTREVQRSIELLMKRLIMPDIVLCREPSSILWITQRERELNESIIQQKILERLGVNIDLKNIVCIPYYPKERIDELGVYIHDRWTRIFEKKSILLWTNNPSKVADYKNFIVWYNILSPKDLKLSLEINENSYSLFENSQKKALEWAKASGLPTLAEDTWFFVNALNGKPWVSVKTWGGELQNPLSEEDFFCFIRKKFESLSDHSCYFLTVLSLGFPDGTVISIANKTEGYVDVKRFDNVFEKGYPLWAVFVVNGREKPWLELTEEEKKKSMKSFVDKINLLIKQYDDKIG